MGLRILIVEEDDAFRAQIARALQGHRIVEATSHAAAVEALEGAPFALVVCGFPLLGQAKGGSSQTVVVSTTGPASDGKVAQALRAGAHDVIARSSDDLLLSTVLRRAVQMITVLQENEALRLSLKRNVEALALQNSRLKELATRDGLTGLYNHRFFHESFKAELSRCRRHDRALSLVLADLDYFKQYNDTQGHLAGDDLLSALGDLLTRESRESTMIARCGGEEFALLVPEADHPGALRYAEKIRSLVETYPFPGRKAHPGGKITMSLGVATFPDNGTDANALMRYADDALYRAKDAGRNIVCG